MKYFILLFLSTFCFAGISHPIISTPCVNSVCQLSDNTPNLVLLWHFNEVVQWDGTVNEVKDSSGNGNHATAGALTNTEISAKFHKSTLHDAGSEYIYRAPSVPELGVDFTVMFWCKLQTITGAAAYVFNNKIAANKWGTSFYMSDSTPNHDFVFTLTSPAGNEEHSGTTPAMNTNVWTHVAFTHNSTNNTISVYIDGVLYKTITTTFNHTTFSPQETNINFGYNNASRHLNGLIDEFAIINEVWSAEKINAYYYASPHRD